MTWDHGLPVYSCPSAFASTHFSITAAAAVRIATRKFGGGKAAGKAAAGAEDDLRPTEGTIWWLKRDLQAKQERYGKKSK